MNRPVRRAVLKLGTDHHPIYTYYTSNRKEIPKCFQTPAMPVASFL